MFLKLTVCRSSRMRTTSKASRRRPAGRIRGENDVVAPEPSGPTPGVRNRLNLFELANERIEDLIVRCELKPGSFLAMQDLQEMTGFGRTPVHQAVSRLAADTLIVVRPRHGLQIAPIDLARERVLLQLRRDIERFVVGLPPNAQALRIVIRSCILLARCVISAKK